MEENWKEVNQEIGTACKTKIASVFQLCKRFGENNLYLSRTNRYVKKNLRLVTGDF